MLACIADAAEQATSAGLNKKMPRTGYTTTAGGVLLQVLPYWVEFTWEMLDFTLRQVEAQLEVRGWVECTWEVSRTQREGGRLLAVGGLWPVAVAGVEGVITTS